MPKKNEFKQITTLNFTDLKNHKIVCVVLNLLN